MSVIPTGVRYGVVVAAMVAVALREWHLVAYPVPSRNAQIPESVATKPYPFGPLQFGFEMGTGLRTFLPSASPHLLALSVVLIPAGVLAALAAGVGFGACRAANLWFTTVGVTRDDWLAAGGREPLLRAVFGTLSLAALALIFVVL